MSRCAAWLKPGGALFIHIFVHREFPYHFEARGSGSGGWPTFCWDVEHPFSRPPTLSGHPHLVQVRGEDDWMAKHFFSGGQMPSDGLLLYFQEGGLAIEHHWRLSGQHYALTAEDWLRNLDRNRVAATELLGATYGRGAALMWLCRWRVAGGYWERMRWRCCPHTHAHTHPSIHPPRSRNAPCSGACSSFPAPNWSPTTEERSGSSPTTSSARLAGEQPGGVGRGGAGERRGALQPVVREGGAGGWPG